MNPKCFECHSCLDLVYFNNIRFWHCWLCDIWYDGIGSELHKITEEEVKRIIDENNSAAVCGK
jgi:hypothetical protein